MKTTNIARISSVICTGFFAVIAASNAAPVTFFGEDLNTGEGTRLVSHPNADAAQAAFLASLVGVGTETFEAGFSDGQGVPLNLTFPGSTGSLTATLSGSGLVRNLPGVGTSAGRYPISGSWFLQEVNANSGSTAFTLQFSGLVAAFGFYGTDFGDFNGVTSLDLINTGLGTTTNVSIGNSTNIPGGAALYFGVIDSAQFDKVVFRNSNPSGGDFFGFDNMTIGDLQQVRNVPDVASSGGLLAGAMLLVLAIRRRK